MSDLSNLFIDEYRKSAEGLEQQRDFELQNIENARRNAYQNIMASANTGGMMYSNFPERTKYQYNTNTYFPNIVKTNTTYQTGLDTIRNNIVDTINKLADLRDATNAQSKANDPTSKFRINDLGDYAYWNNPTGTTQYRNAQGQNIRFGTAAKNAGFSNVSDILGYAAQTLKGQDEINRLNNLWEKAKEQGYTGFAYNVGDTFEKNANNFLTDAENDFLDSLGLKFQ